MTPRTAEDEFDVDSLPPTQYLVMETLAARYRLGEACWTFPTHCISAARLDALLSHGLIGWKRGVVERSYLVWLTDKGKRATMSDTYVPPVLASGVSR